MRSFRRIASRHQTEATRPSSILPVQIISPSQVNRPIRGNWQIHNPFLQISKEVRDAVRTRRPVVALETTIYTHGFPYPENVALASRLEAIIRDKGGIPATIGILNGVAKVGFSKNELNELLESAGTSQTMKVSRRDLGYILGKKKLGLNGGTTIAGTIILARLAGIDVFATGGLGGVHQGGENSMDISADLTELGRSRIALISSGCKSFLDIPRTLEYLETQGVGVSTFADGRHGMVDFPAFWTRESGTPSPSVVQDASEAASIFYAQKRLGIRSGLLFANPIAENVSLDKTRMDTVMNEAIQEADRLGISGNENTPFILKRIRELTDGDTVKANEALVQANVQRGIEVAVELSRLEHNRDEFDHSTPIKGTSSLYSAVNKLNPLEPIESGTNISIDPTVLVAGSLAIDLACDYAPLDELSPLNKSDTPLFHTSNPAVIAQSLGGVGQNVATALYYLGTDVKLCSVVADDLAGNIALDILRQRGMRTDGIRVDKIGARTAQYISFNDTKKALIVAMADMRIINNCLPLPTDKCEFGKSAKWLVLDANWSPAKLAQWVRQGRAERVKVAFEPVSVEKAKRLFIRGQNIFVDIATPNKLELEAMWTAAKESDEKYFQAWHESISNAGKVRAEIIDKAQQQLLEQRRQSSISFSVVDMHAHIPRMLDLLGYMDIILTKLGENGVLMAEALYYGNEDFETSTRRSYFYRFPQPLRRSQSSKIITGVYFRYFPAFRTVPATEVISVNGVGDTFLGIIIAGLAAGVKRVENLVPIAQEGAILTLKSPESVSETIQTLRPQISQLTNRSHTSEPMAKTSREDKNFESRLRITRKK